MKICDDLRQAVLQAAIQGKLTTQRPEDGDARELLKQIAAEKAKLIKEKKIKKEKPLPDITEDEIPFDVPENWVWCRLGALTIKDIKRGKSPVYTAKSSVMVFAQKCNVKAGGINMHLALYLDETRLGKYPENEFLLDKDIVINSTGTGTMGRVGLFRDTDRIDGMRIVPDSHVTVIRASNLVNPEYLYYYLSKSQSIFEENGDGSTNQKELKAIYLNLFCVPLPPLAEQRRIVAKVEKLMAEIDKLEKVENELHALKTAFPGDMKAALLQAAMQGKLTTQRKEDGDARDLLKQIAKEKEQLIKEKKIKKEKPLPEITEDEIPFDVPENWVWCRLLNLGLTSTGNTPSTTNAEYYGGDTPFIGPADITYGKGISYNTSKKLTKTGEQNSRVVSNGTILQVCIGGSIGKCAIIDRKVAFNQQINSISPLVTNSIYLLNVISSRFFLLQMKENSTGTATPIINRGLWEKLLLPLPPLAEQQRIVAKLEKLLPLCDGLVEE